MSARARSSTTSTPTSCHRCSAPVPACSGRLRSPTMRWHVTGRRLPVRGRIAAMRVLLVHPSPLMYSEIFLRLEPIGLERVATAIRATGHDVRLLDLQIFRHADFARALDEFKPQA